MDKDKLIGWLLLIGLIAFCVWGYYRQHEDPFKVLSETNPPKSSVPMFSGFPCKTANCKGHTAGYDWASEHSVTDKADCEVAGEHYHSVSFEQGCIAYVNDGRYDPQ